MPPRHPPAVFAAALLLAACASTGPLVEPAAVPAPADPVSSRLAMLRALASAQFEYLGEENGEVRARRSEGAAQATVALKSEGGAWRVRHLESAGLDFDPAKGTIGPRYGRWTGELAAALQSQCSRMDAKP